MFMFRENLLLEHFTSVLFLVCHLPAYCIFVASATSEGLKPRAKRLVFLNPL